MDLESAEEGQRYKVVFYDCCVQGEFTATLTRKNYVPAPPDPEPFLESLTFGNGVTISGHGISLEEPSTEDEPCDCGDTQAHIQHI